MSKRLACGFEVSYTQAGWRDEYPSVRLHRMGGESLWLTPDEALALAKALSDAAENAARRIP